MGKSQQRWAARGLDSRLQYVYTPSMAYLRILSKSGTRYFYIMRSVRMGKKVVPKVLEYLGKEPAPARLKRALGYWEVKWRPGKGGRRR